MIINRHNHGSTIGEALSISDVAVETLRAETCMDVRKAVSGLDPKLQNFIFLRFTMGYSANRISRETDAPLRQVKRALAKGKNQLRAPLQATYDEAVQTGIIS